MMLTLVPITLKEARAFVDEHHRHHEAPQGGLFAVGCAMERRVVGVSIIGRPVARLIDADFTAEVTRLCVDRSWLDPYEEGAAAGVWVRAREAGLRGVAHAERVLRDARKSQLGVSSLLYGAAWRAARALGYRKLITYILPEEGGASLRAAGWRCVGKAGGGSWSCPSRPRVDTHPTQQKLRWEMAEASA